MRVGLIYTGGTIDCAKSGGVISLSGVKLADYLDSAFKVTEYRPYITLSEKMNTALYLKLIGAVTVAAAENDAVIVAHGTDTLSYTSALLSMAFASSAVPIVLVSSDAPLSDPGANGPINLYAADIFIKQRFGGVFVSYANSEGLPAIHFGARLTEPSAFSAEYNSPLDKICGFIENDEFLMVEKPKKRYKVFNNLTLVKDVCIIKPYPEMDYSVFAKVNCPILHDSYHSGTVNTDALNEFVTYCKGPVYMVGGEHGKVYESRLNLSDKIKVCDNITLPAMYFKLKLLYENFGAAEADKMIRTDLAGEIF